MEIKVKTRKIGGSLGVILPKQLVKQEKIAVDDLLTLDVEKTVNLDFLWGKLKDIKKPTDQIMNEIDEGEDD